MDTILHDLRHAGRFLLKRPGFALAATLSLAIGVGATSAVFSVANSLLLRPPPGIGEPERVVEVGRTMDGRGFDTFTYPDFLDYRAQAEPLQELAGWRFEQLSYAAGGEAVRVQGLLVSANYFDAVGVRPARGRFFLPEEDENPGAHPVAVVSYRFWRDRLDADPAVLARTLDLNRQSYAVVGVTPADFRGHMTGLQPDVYVPLMMAPHLGGEDPSIFEQRNSSWFHALGRLAPDATLEEANAALATVADRLRQRFPDSHSRRGARAVQIGPVPGGGRGPVTAFLGFILGLTAIVLLVTCANVAGMLLARAAARGKEVAIRLALGSGRARLVRQLLTESLGLFALGGLAGVGLAYAVTRTLEALPLPVPVPVELSFAPDGRVLLFALALSLLTGIAFGLAPALQATTPDLVPALKEETGSGRGQGARLRRGFVAAQVALSAILLVSSGLFLRALQRVASADLGFRAEGVEMLSLDLSLDGYEEEEGATFYRRLLEEAQRIPGARTAALANDLPMDLSSHGTPIYPEGWEDRDRPGLPADFNVVSSGYFETLGIPLLRGRPLEPRDDAGATPVAVVSRELARRVWGDEDPLGRRFRWGGSERPLLTVVGVVEDTPNQLVTDGPEPMVYLPLSQHYRASMNLLVASARPAATLGPAMRSTVRALDARLSLTPVQSVSSYTRIGIIPQRVAAVVSAALGALALLLSGVGVYGVVAYAVARRTREIGIRMALGARRGQVLRLILASGLRTALPGLVLGGVAALGLGRLIRSFLLGVPSGDPVTFGTVAAVLLAVVVAGALLPARRAAAVEPMRALRVD